jgi:hypothetical protein
MAIWSFVAFGALFVVLSVILRHWTPQYTTESRHYLLSSSAQVLAAILALAITVPLMFAGLSRYLPSAGYFLVRSPLFLGYAILYATTIALSLGLLRFECAASTWTDIDLILSILCVVAVVPYVIWISSRMDPAKHIDLVLAKAGGLTQTPESATSVGKYEVLVGLTTQFASVASEDCAMRYFGYAIYGLLILMVSDDASNETHYSRTAFRSLSGFASAHAKEAVGGSSTVEAITSFGFGRYLREGARMSERVGRNFATILGYMAGQTPAEELPARVAMIAIWTIGPLALLPCGDNANVAQPLVEKAKLLEAKFGPQLRQVLVTAAMQNAESYCAGSPEHMATFRGAASKFWHLVNGS